MHVKKESGARGSFENLINCVTSPESASVGAEDHKLENEKHLGVLERRPLT